MKICSSILKFLSRLLVDGQRKSIFNRTSAGTRKHASHSPPTALRPNKHLKPVALNINSPAWTQKIFGAGVSRRFVGALGGRACAASLCLTEQTASHVGRGQHVLLEWLCATEVRVSRVGPRVYLFARAVHGRHFPGHRSPSSSQFSLRCQLECLGYFLPLVCHTNMETFAPPAAWPALETESPFHHSVAPGIGNNANVKQGSFATVE